MIIKGEYTTKRWKVRSKSQPGIYRIIELTNNGKLYCDCPAGSFRNECSHIKKVKLYGTQQQTN